MSDPTRIRRRRNRTAAAAAALALAVSPAVAAAQLAAGSNGPIDITADDGVFDNATCTSTWSGAAEVLQGDARLRADVIKAFLAKKPAAPAAPGATPGRAPQQPGLPGGQGEAGCGATQRIEADGDVFYVTPQQVARGDHAVYTAGDGRIVMTGNVIVVQGKDVIHGDKMTIQVAKRQVEFDSLAQGRGAQNRVRGVFYQGQPGQAGLPSLPGPAPAAAPPAPAMTGRSG